MRASIVSGAVCLSGIFLATPVRADSLAGTRSDQVHERAHVIELRLEPGHAEMTVRRTIENKGPRNDQAVYALNLPAGGVATGLRTLGVVNGEHQWFSAELMEREEAAKRYRELTGFGMAIPKDPALLYWVGLNRVGLQVFPVAPGGLKTVEYTVKLPTWYEDGRDVVTIPSSLALDDVVPEIVVSSKDPQDRIFTDAISSLRFCSTCDLASVNRPLAQGARLQLWGGDIHFALEHVNAPRIGGRLAAIPIHQGRALSHFRVELPRRLSQVPRGARVVVLIDASRSMADDVGAEIAATRAYLAHFVDAEVEIVPFDRAPHPKYGAFTPAAAVLGDLKTWQPSTKNGSNLDDALTKADALLRSAPPGAARRVVLFSDLRTRSTLTPALVKGKLAASGALLHVVDIHEGGASLMRDDDGDWASVPRATGGLLWSGAASLSDATHSRDVFEELARPKRVDRLRFVAGGWPADMLEASAPASLEEGESWEDTRLSDVGLRSLDVVGEIWSSPVKQSLLPDAAEAKHWAALFFGSPDLFELEDAEMMTLARLGGAVTPVTSYLASEPGVRPSYDGLLEGEGVGLGEGGGGEGYGVGHGRVGTAGGFDAEAWLENALAKEWDRCGGKSQSLTLTIETTSDEIVDARASASDPVAKCIVEATWSLDLPKGFNSSFATYALKW
jgi:hypothetical protein